MKHKIMMITALITALALSSCQNNSDDTDTVAPVPSTESGGPTPTPPPAPTPIPDRSLKQGFWGTDGLKMVVKANTVEFQFACELGKVNGKITPNSNRTFKRTGTIKYFNNVTGENEIHPAVFEGITSDNRNVIAVRITYTDTRPNGGADSRDYVLRKNFEPEPMVCAFSD